MPRGAETNQTCWLKGDMERMRSFMKTGAIVLAAGIPRDIHAFRPLIYVGNKTMIRHIVETLKEAAVDDIVVVTGYRSDAVSRHLEQSRVQIVRNRFYETSQMIDSLLLGAASLRPDCDRLLILPADVPLVRCETIQTLLKARAPVVRPVCKGISGHPLVITGAVLSQLKEYQGDGGLEGFLCSEGIEILDVSVTDEAVLIDANTEEQVDRLRAYESLCGDSLKLHMEFDLRLAIRDVIMDHEMAQLLELVEHTGSLQSASGCVESSYSKNWRRIQGLEDQLGTKIFQSVKGGVKGGGSRLTKAGKQLLHSYRAMQQEGRRFLEWSFAEHFPEEFVEMIQNMEE